MSSPRRSAPWSASETAGTLFVLAMLAVATAAAWPIYRTTSYLVLVGVAVAAGAAIAVVQRRWGSSGMVVAASFVVYVVLGMTLAVPVWSHGASASARGVVAGTVTAWKDLVTVDLPVGGYRNLLVPALIVFFGGTLGGLLLAWRPGRSAVSAVPLLLAAQLFGLIFGPDTSGQRWVVAGLELAPRREAVLGLAGFLVALGWLAWRARSARAGALRRAARAGGLPAPHRRVASTALRAASFVAVLLVAVLVGVSVAPAVGGEPRQVLRTGHGPDLQVRAAVSPLTQYRLLYDTDLYETPLFTVSAQGPMPDRVRLAVLTAYDGQSFTVGSPAEPTQLRRVPSRLTPQPGTATRVTIQGGDLGDAFAPLWLPVAGSLESVAFSGPRARALADGFYYDRGTGSAVNTAPGGLRQGDEYRIDATTGAAVDVGTLTAPGGSPRWKAPESLLAWLEANPVTRDGAGLARAVETLRSRGFLSHDVDADVASMPWIAALAPQGYQYVPSAAGHSLGRIDQIFRELNERQREVVRSGASESMLVGAVGDDEQFATAVALLADQLGFPARVVLGARLADAEDPIDPGLPACSGGVCTGGSMTAWVEVQGADGRWAALDVTPQYRQPIVDQPQDTRLPENATEVLPQTAQEVAPPDPLRSGGSQRTSSQVDDDPGTSRLWPVLRAVAMGLLVLLVLLGPPGTVVLAKTLRRRVRRQAPDVRERIAGGWEELVDTAVDHGVRVPDHRTRRELASGFGTGAALALAGESDRATYSDTVVTDDEAHAFWEVVEAECQDLRAQASPWRRLRAAVSLASLLRRRPSDERRARPSDV